MDNINAEWLRRILAGESVNGFELGRGNYIGPQQTSEGNDQTGNLANFENVIYQRDPRTTGTTARWNTWNTDGTYRGYGSGPGQTIDDIIMAATGALLGGAAMGAAGSGSTAGMTASEKAAMMAANGMTDAEIAAALGGQAAADLTTGTLATGAGTSAVTQAVQNANTANQVKNAVDGGSTMKQAVDALGGAKAVGALLGAAAGAADSKDKQETQSKDPWLPAQDALKGLLADGTNLYHQYRQQPFSQAQQTAYGNMGGFLDSINQSMPGLLQGANAMASGQNQFVRGRPGLLTGSGPMQFNYQPGLLGDFGTRRG